MTLRDSIREEQIYLEGYRDGTHAKAVSAAQRLMSRESDREIAFITGLSVADVAELRIGKIPSGNKDYQPGGAKAGLRESASSFTTLTEPLFVKLVRGRNGFTQAEFADAVGVNERTVRTWECSDRPVRMKSTTYAKIVELGGGSV